MLIETDPRKAARIRSFVHKQIKKIDALSPLSPMVPVDANTITGPIRAVLHAQSQPAFILLGHEVDRINRQGMHAPRHEFSSSERRNRRRKVVRTNSLEAAIIPPSPYSLAQKLDKEYKDGIDKKEPLDDIYARMRVMALRELAKAQGIVGPTIEKYCVPILKQLMRDGIPQPSALWEELKTREHA